MNDPRRNEVSGIGHDPPALTAFYTTHLETVQRFIARRVSDPHLAADLTADVFLAAMKGAKSYKPDRGTPEAWLIGVARNVVNAEFRRAARYRAAARSVSGRELLDADSLADIEDRIDAERAARDIYGAIRRLRSRDRALIELIAVDGMSVADAGRLLGISEGAARVRWHRSRTAIKGQVAVAL